MANSSVKKSIGSLVVYRWKVFLKLDQGEWREITNAMVREWYHLSTEDQVPCGQTIIPQWICSVMSHTLTTGYSSKHESSKQENIFIKNNSYNIVCTFWSGDNIPHFVTRTMLLQLPDGISGGKQPTPLSLVAIVTLLPSLSEWLLASPYTPKQLPFFISNRETVYKNRQTGSPKLRFTTSPLKGLILPSWPLMLTFQDGKYLDGCCCTVLRYTDNILHIYMNIHLYVLFIWIRVTNY